MICESIPSIDPPLQMNSRVPLQGAELEAYLQKEKVVKEKEAAHQAVLARNQRMLEADEDESDSDSDADSEEESEVRLALEDPSAESPTYIEGQEPVSSGGGRRKSDKIGDASDWAMDGDEGLTKQLLSYDIYLKGNVSKSTSFFKNVGGQSQRFRMFPYVEKKRRVDEYGEMIDVGMWLRKGKVLEEDAESDETKDARRRKQAEDDAKVTVDTMMPSAAHLLSISRRRSRNRHPSSYRRLSTFSWHVVSCLWIWKV
jgi:cleavage and polyadenylation specificity factor subunit 2